MLNAYNIHKYISNVYNVNKIIQSNNVEIYSQIGLKLNLIK